LFKDYRGNQLLGVICLFNRTEQVIKTDEFAIKNVTNEPKSFNPLECPAAHPIFMNILVSNYQQEKLALTLQMENQEERRVLTMVDNILRYPSMKRFMEIVEEEFAKFFNAERANFLIVNRYNKEMYRIIYDQENKEFKMRLYSLEKGIAGSVVVSGQTSFVDGVEDDIRFNKEVDDPKGSHGEQMVAVPIYCTSDRLDTSIHSLSTIPRGVIQIINKKDPNGFQPKVLILQLII
jgi:hypothetical protein